MQDVFVLDEAYDDDEEEKRKKKMALGLGLGLGLGIPLVAAIIVGIVLAKKGSSVSPGKL